jgi:predicted N-acetyltransferase YhbS
MKLSNLFDPHSTRPNTRPTIAVLTSCGTPSQPYNEQISRQLTEARSQLGTHSKAYRALRAISHVLESQKLFENDPEISDTSIWLYTEGCQSALHILLDNHTAKITWLGSLNGTGRQLLEQGLAQSQKQGASLAVVKPIWNSHKFYEQMGFQDQGTGYWNLPLVESADQLDRADLEDLLGEIKYEQEEIDNASYDAAGSKYEKLDQDFKALEAVAYVVKNNLRALDDPKLGKNSIFLYNYTPDLGVFSVTAIHVVIENQVAHVKWLGSYDNKPGAGKALMLQALTVAKSKGATKSVVEAKWESEGFYHKLGYDVEHRGSDNPFTGTSLVQMGKKLEEGWSEEDQRMIHKNPTIQDLKRLARNNKYHSARFVIYKDGSVVAADSEHFTHHSAAPAMGAWALRGYVQYLGNNDYAYRSMEVYSPKSVDHPIFRVWERAGIENGNPDHQRNQISEDVSPKRQKYRATWRGRLAEYDPNFFDVEEDKYTDDDGKVILVKDKLIPRPNLKANLDITPNPQLVYRGMSNAEFEVIKKTGKIQSRGDYNMGGQEGLTYFSTDPQSAEAYANSFAPWKYKATWDKPAWVIAVPKPDPSRVRKVTGTGEHEVGIKGAIPASEIQEVYRGRVVEYDPGVPEQVAPSAWLHWEKIPVRFDKITEVFALDAGLPLVELDTDTVEENWTKK